MGPGPIYLAPFTWPHLLKNFTEDPPFCYKVRNLLTSREKEFLIRLLKQYFFDNRDSGLKEREVREKRTQPPLL